MTKMVGAKGKEVSKEVFNRKVTKEDIQALKDAGIDNPLWDDESDK